MKEIPLTQGKVALVDDGDYEWLSAHKWCATCEHGRWYARRCARGSNATIRMRRMILGLSTGDGVEIDHRNGDGLDNRRRNLRLATHSQNMANGGPRRNNSSGFRGVYWHKQARKWRAQIFPHGVGIQLGYFATAAAAADAYRHAAERHYGGFAFHRRTEIQEPRR